MKGCTHTWRTGCIGSGCPCTYRLSRPRAGCAFCGEAGRVPDQVWGRYVPGWYFFAPYRELPERLVALTQEDVWLRARGAVVLLTTLRARAAALWPPLEQAPAAGEIVPVGGSASSHTPIEVWINLLGASSTGEAALQYLHDVAAPTDRTLLADIAAAAEGQAWGAAAQAVIASVNGDRVPALDHLLGHSYSPAAWLVDDAASASPTQAPTC